jgi:SAM-dependent methyltransferase
MSEERCRTSLPRIVDLAADGEFRALARTQGLDPDGTWVGGYVEYEWSHGRHVIETSGIPLAGAKALEFGCNVGATSIVLALLGARVTGIDVDPGIVGLATLNATRYGVGAVTDFFALEDTRRLPFADQEFDMIVCNSVLEYIPRPIRREVQQEMDRTLRRGGVVFVTGTSNRLWPREVHSGRWIVNYLPEALDRLVRPARSRQRGMWPWEIRHGWSTYENLDLHDQGRSYLTARRRMGANGMKYTVLRWTTVNLATLGLWMGLLAPSMAVTLRKP